MIERQVKTRAKGMSLSATTLIAGARLHTISKWGKKGIG